jgi:DNA repair exonuclease SbcCD ATPase subunit
MAEIIRSMEKEVERREIELTSWRDRYQAVKKSYDEQLCNLLFAISYILAEAEKLRDMILTKEGENNQLKDKITSLQEDIDTVSLFLSPAERGTFLCALILPVRSRFVAVCRRKTDPSFYYCKT